MTRKHSRRTILGAAVSGIVGLSGCLGEPEYSIQAISNEQPTGPLTLETGVVDSSILVNSNGKIRLAVTNESEEPIELQNRGITPFGVPEAERGTEGPSFRIWSPAYETSTSVDVTSRRQISINRELLSTIIEPDETVATVYEIRGSNIPGEGEYRIGHQSSDPPEGVDPIEWRDSLLRYRRRGGESADTNEVTMENPTVLLRIEKRQFVRF